MDEQRNITFLESLFLSVGRFGKNYISRLRMFNRNIRLILFGQFLIGLGFTFWRLLFNLYLREAGYDNEVIGDTLFLQNIASAAAALPAGYIAGRFSRKPILLVAPALSVIFLALAIVSSSEGALNFFIFLGFTCVTFVIVIGGPFIMSNTSEVERTYAFSANFIIMLVGGISGNIIAGWLRTWISKSGVNPVLGYRYVILSGLAMSLLGIVPFIFIRETESTGAGEGRLDLKDFRKWDWKLFSKALLPAVLVAIGAGLMVQFMNLYFKTRFESTDREIGFYLAAQAATMIFGVMLAPVLAEKIGKVRTIVGTELISLPFMIMLALTHNVHLAVFALLMRASLMNMSQPVSSSLLLGLCKKKEQGILNALLTMAWSASWGLSALGFGRVFEGNYTFLFMTAVVLYFTSAIVYFVFFRSAEAGREKSDGKAGG